MQNQNTKDLQRSPSSPSTSMPFSDRSVSYLGPGLSIKGEITGNEDLKLESQFEGLISIGGFRVSVEPRARVVADIIAREAVISGEVSGDISAHDRIEVKKSASVTGALSTAKIMIEEGAYFKGNIEIGTNGDKQIGADLDSLLKGAEKTN